MSGTGLVLARYQWARNEELAMSLFKKKDGHVGSGLDKPKPKGILKKMVETAKSVSAPSKPAMPPKNG